MNKELLAQYISSYQFLADRYKNTPDVKTKVIIDDEMKDILGFLSLHDYMHIPKLIKGL